MTDLIVTSDNIPCYIEIRRYHQPANIHISLWSETEGPVVTASVNVAQTLPAGHVAVKNYSENRGVLEALVAAGVVTDTGRRIPVGYAHAHLCRLLIEPE